jgi:hypothetical protein
LNEVFEASLRLLLAVLLVGFCHRVGVFQMKKLRRPTRATLQKHFRPYAVELGMLTLAWNQLHERLAMLFWNAIGGQNGAPSIAIWQYLRSDKMQRDVLKVAIEAGAFNARYNGPKATEDVLWLIGKVNILADQRNDAIHAPLAAVTNTQGIRIEPHIFLENPRALKLHGKDLLSEFIWYRATADVLSVYANDLHACLSFPKVKWTWPERPSLPNRGQKNTPRPRLRAHRPPAK